MDIKQQIVNFLNTQDRRLYYTDYDVSVEVASRLSLWLLRHDPHKINALLHSPQVFEELKINNVLCVYV